MPFLENIVEGLSEAAGNDSAVSRIEKNKADRRSTQHEELQANTQLILNDVTRLQNRLQQLDPSKDQKEIGSIQAELHRKRQEFTDLYHPEKNPGALGKLGDFIKSHLSKQPVSSPAEAKQRMSMVAPSAIPGGAPAPVNPYIQTREQMKAAGFSDEDITASERHKAGISDRDNWKQTRVTSKSTGETFTAWTAGPKKYRDLAGNELDASDLEVSQKQPTGQFQIYAASYAKYHGVKPEDLTPEQIDFIRQRMAYDQKVSGTSTGTTFKEDIDHNWVPITVTNARGPGPAPQDPLGDKPKSGGSSNIPKTPKEAKDKVQRPGSPPKSNVNVGPALFKSPHLTPDQSASKKKWEDAIAVAKKADLVAQHPDDAVNQKQLAVALERAAAGRFTTQALDYILKAGWGNSIEQWANNPKTGALPADIIRQLIQGAHQNVDAAKAAFDASMKPIDDGGATDSTKQFTAPPDAPQAPKEDGHKLKANGQVIAVSKGGQWVAP